MTGMPSIGRVARIEFRKLGVDMQLYGSRAFVFHSRGLNGMRFRAHNACISFRPMLL
jgi:hypothetical protein